MIKKLLKKKKYEEIIERLHHKYQSEKEKTETNQSLQNELKVLQVDPNTGKTALNIRTKDRVDELRDFIINEKIDPWLFIWHKSFKVTKADGSIIDYPGLEYGGSLRAIFWGKDYIDPFLKEGIRKVLDDTSKECQENKIKTEEPLKEAGSLLAGLIRNVYGRMAEIDSKLLKKGEEEKNNSRKDVSEKVESMDKYLSEQLSSALALSN